VGNYSLVSNTTGVCNVAIGYCALGSNTTDESSTAIGFKALNSNNSGTKNTAVGAFALSQGNGASCSDAFGHRALYNNTGNFNVGIGTDSLFSLTSGFKNTAVGNNAGNNITSAACNTFIGNSAGYNLTSGNNNTIIGRFATSSSSSVSNEITLGDSNVDKLRMGNGQVLYGAEQTLTDGSTISWDSETAPIAKVTLGGNRTISASSNGIAGSFVSLLVIQDGTGSRTLTWNAAYEFKDDTAPTLTATANKGDLFTFRYNGAKWLEVGRNTNLTLS